MTTAMPDARTRVRDAVRRLVRDPSAWPAPTWTIFRNRLLDECGGDQRALIGLVVQAGELGVPAQLGRVRVDDATWRTMRTPQVLALIGESFLQPEAAQWAVDVWGVALGVIAPGADSAMPIASSAPPARPTVARASVSRASSPPPPVMRATSSGATRSVPPPPKAVTWLTNISLAIIGLGVLWVIGGSISRVRQPRTALPVAEVVGAPRAAGEQAEPLRAGGAPALRSEAPTAAGLPAGTSAVVRPPERAGVPNALVTRVPPAALQAAQPGVDQLMLKDGRSLIGRVDIIRASDIVFRESATGLRYEFPRTEVSYIVTEFGSIVRFEAEVAASPAVRAMVARGLVGRYAVRYARREVQGSAVCESLWQDTPPDDSVTVRHVAGQDTLALAFDRGTTFRAIVDRDGLFNSSFVIVPDQAFSSTAVTTRLSGRFVAGGFDAAVHVIGYRRVRGGGDVTCYSILDATAR